MHRLLIERRSLLINAVLGHLGAASCKAEEKPIPLPKGDGKATEPQFYHPENTLQRLPGTRYTFAAMDANADIYKQSLSDFEVLMKSVTVDTK